MTDKLKELRQWLDEDKSISKADKDYICNFIKENYVSKDKVEGLKMKEIESFGEDDDGYNNAVYIFNNSIEEVLK